MQNNAELWFAILAFVLLGAALASGVVDHIPLSLPIVFLGLGLLLGLGALKAVGKGFPSGLNGASGKCMNGGYGSNA